MTDPTPASALAHCRALAVWEPGEECGRLMCELQFVLLELEATSQAQQVRQLRSFYMTALCAIAGGHAGFTASSRTLIIYVLEWAASREG